jgi:hypothetical protein
MTTSARGRVSLRYDVPRVCDDWTLPEEPMPESQPHDIVLDLLKALLLAWVARMQRDAQVARNLALRWDEQHPKVGVDPDICVIAPRPPEGDELQSLCLWRPGHTAPLCAFEVVSERHPRKDYATAPDRYAASGTRELVVFDPKLAGPKSHGGPHRIQVWSRADDGLFQRTYAGEGPARSDTLDAWLFAVDEGRKLRMADDAAGTQWWQTEAELAHARVAELERELAKLRGG